MTTFRMRSCLSLRRAPVRVAALLTACVLLSGLAWRQESVLDWITRNAIPLKTVAAGNGFADMHPLKSVVGDARIVVLGEATHGTREFFQLKHRMLKFLASEMGFSIFAMEASMAASAPLNEYVLTGKGDPATLLHGLGIWVWDTEEVLDMIRWMRSYNASGRGRLQFMGFDMQVPTLAFGTVDSFVTTMEPAYLDVVEEATELARVMNRPIPAGGAAAFVDSLGRAAAAWRRIAAHLDSGTANYPDPATAWAAQSARVVLQAVQLRLNQAPRDQGMAENIKWILDHNPGEKIVVWAHNAHVATVTPNGGGQVDPMGGTLRTMFGQQMVSFGFAFNQGSFRAGEVGKPIRAFDVVPEPGSFDALLAATRVPVLALDLRRTPRDGAVGAWFSAPQKVRWASGVYSDSLAKSRFLGLIAPKSFDAILFIEKTTPSRPTPGASTN